MRENVNIDEMQFRFMPGKGKADGIFVARLVEIKRVPYILCICGIGKSICSISIRIVALHLQFDTNNYFLIYIIILYANG